MQDHNVLVIAYYFPPMGLSGIQRTAKFVKYLPEHGWNPIVLTCTPNSYYAYDDSLLAELDSISTQIYRTPGKKGKKAKEHRVQKFPSYFTQKVGRAVLQSIFQPDSKRPWKKKALKLADKIIEENNIDAIFSTAPPFTDFLIASEISKKHGIPYIVDYRDAWIDNEFHFYLTPFHKQYSIGLEKKILTQSDKIIVLTRYAKEMILKRYNFLSHNDILIIPHGYDEEDFAQVIEPDKNKFVITHSGLFQDNRTPKYFFEALAKFLQNNPEAKNVLEAHFVGLMRKAHTKFISKYGLDDIVKLKGYVSHNSAVRHIRESDVLWFMADDTVRTPGKIFEYFAAQRSILACVPDGAIKDLVQSSNAAITVGPKDIDAIVRALDTFYKQWKDGILPFPSKEFNLNYNRRFLSATLARELSLAADI